jgi:hypothetical protein
MLAGSGSKPMSPSCAVGSGKHAPGHEGRHHAVRRRRADPARGRTARLVEEGGVLVAAGETPVDDDVVFALIDAGRK